ncbi:hypothetical protein U0070_004847 [Myodes glareolus]|uniref:Uncharacterized protein n=1 Tax=Myodes glareolus TaxID=447135 RepID=A0AAW0J506_MYOGA
MATMTMRLGACIQGLPQTHVVHCGVQDGPGEVVQDGPGEVVQDGPGRPSTRWQMRRLEEHRGRNTQKPPWDPEESRHQKADVEEGLMRKLLNKLRIPEELKGTVAEGTLESTGHSSSMDLSQSTSSTESDRQRVLVTGGAQTDTNPENQRHASLNVSDFCLGSTDGGKECQDIIVEMRGEASRAVVGDHGKIPPRDILCSEFLRPPKFSFPSRSLLLLRSSSIMHAISPKHDCESELLHLMKRGMSSSIPRGSQLGPQL